MSNLSAITWSMFAVHVLSVCTSSGLQGTHYCDLSSLAPPSSLSLSLICFCGGSHFIQHFSFSSVVPPLSFIQFFSSVPFLNPSPPPLSSFLLSLFSCCSFFQLLSPSCLPLHSVSSLPVSLSFSVTIAPFFFSLSPYSLASLSSLSSSLSLFLLELSFNSPHSPSLSPSLCYHSSLPSSLSFLTLFSITFHPVPHCHSD